MLKYFMVLVCVFTVSFAGIQDYINLSGLIVGDGKIPTKVRTIEEVNRMSEQNEPAVLDFIGLVNQHIGYEAEEYTVVTVDGYKLGLHRINSSPSSPKAKGKSAVFIQHGIFGSSDFFVLLGPNQSLAFQLADAGYDVWIGNVRGNTYSRSHQKLNPKNPKFWNYSLDEAGMIDMAELIDFILDKTNKKDLTFIGYSMGTTLSYILLSSRPGYNKKINLLVSIAPIAYFTSSKNIFLNGLLTATNHMYTLATYLNQQKTYEVFSQSFSMKQFANEECREEMKEEINPCKMAFSIVANVNNMNTTAIPTILAHIPAGTSYYTLRHYQQLINSNGKFQKYDYDCSYLDFTCPDHLYTNKRRYDQDTPPEYDLSLITTPHAIFYATNDLLVSEQDVEYLKNKLNNDSVVAYERVPDENFNHLDFAWSKDAKNLVYNRIIEIISTNV